MNLCLLFSCEVMGPVKLWTCRDLGKNRQSYFHRTNTQTVYWACWMLYFGVICSDTFLDLDADICVQSQLHCDLFLSTDAFEHISKSCNSGIGICSPKRTVVGFWVHLSQSYFWCLFNFGFQWTINNFPCVLCFHGCNSI